MTRRALVSFAVGDECARLAAITFPRFVSYAARHEYEFVTPEAAGDRPPSWRKLPAFVELFERFDELLWLDADVLIVDESRDLAADVDTGFLQALVFHRDAAGSEIPNCGVWLLRPAMLAYLERAWRRVDLVNHAWWEQAAIVELLGYRLAGRKLVATESPVERNWFNRATARLDHAWNDHPFDVTPRGAPRFVHAVGSIEQKLARLESCAQ